MELSSSGESQQPGLATSGSGRIITLHTARKRRFTQACCPPVQICIARAPLTLQPAVPVLVTAQRA